MSQFARSYPDVEIAISTQSYSPLASGHERVQEGDIVTVVGKLRTSRGLKAGKLFLWLRIYGEEIAFLQQLMEHIFDLDGDGDPGKQFDKKRFNIPLQRLKNQFPAFDLVRARDPLDDYQPFIPFDEDDFRYLEGPALRPFALWGLVVDKKTLRLV